MYAKVTSLGVTGLAGYIVQVDADLSGGLLRGGTGLIKQRPFRSPHHSVSSTAIVGGGSVPRLSLIHI